jgi:hypothetical protein
VSIDDKPAANRLDVGRHLMAFNWLTAGYAHSDWLGPWAEILRPRRPDSGRMVRRASIMLLNRYNLRDRYIRDISGMNWLLQPNDKLVKTANALGVAMLGSWVQKRLERQEVALQLKVLGPAGRGVALARSKSLRALPFPVAKEGWPVALTGTSTVPRLGLSCMAALLVDETSGARERFTLRFASGMVVPLDLTDPQRDEAFALIHATLDGAEAT